MVQADTQEAPPDLLIDNQAVYKRKVCLGGRCIHSEVGLQLSLGLEDELQKLCPARRVRHRGLQLAICASNPQFLMVQRYGDEATGRLPYQSFPGIMERSKSHFVVYAFGAGAMPLGLALSTACRKPKNAASCVRACICC